MRRLTIPYCERASVPQRGPTPRGAALAPAQQVHGIERHGLSISDAPALWARDRIRTNVTNLIGLCRKHHRLKSEPDWMHHAADDGTLTVTTPAGRTYTSEPDEPPF